MIVTFVFGTKRQMLSLGVEAFQILYFNSIFTQKTGTSTPIGTVLYLTPGVCFPSLAALIVGH